MSDCTQQGGSGHSVFQMGHSCHNLTSSNLSTKFLFVYCNKNWSNERKHMSSFNSTKKWNYKWGLTCCFMGFYGGLKHLTFQANNFGVVDLESVDKIPISGQFWSCRS